jgi:hypothetical protein
MLCSLVNSSQCFEASQCFHLWGQQPTNSFLLGCLESVSTPLWEEYGNAESGRACLPISMWATGTEGQLYILSVHFVSSSFTESVSGITSIVLFSRCLQVQVSNKTSSVTQLVICSYALLFREERNCIV